MKQQQQHSEWLEYPRGVQYTVNNQYLSCSVIVHAWLASENKFIIINSGSKNVLLQTNYRYNASPSLPPNPNNRAYSFVINILFSL